MGAPPPAEGGPTGQSASAHHPGSMPASQALVSSLAVPLQQSDKEYICQLLLDLSVLEKREAALADLSKRREQFPDLAPLLWHSFGTIAAILQEIISI